MKILTKNFSEKEMSCKCGTDCGAFMDSAFMWNLQILRTFMAVPFTINSAARCPKYNKAVGGVPDSMHLSDKKIGGARACDISCTDSLFRFELVKESMRLGFCGIGVAKTFIHIDTRPKEQSKMWTY